MGKPFSIFRTILHVAALGILVLALASILFPWPRGGLQNSFHTAAASNLAQIAKTYAAYSNGSTNGRNIQLPPGSTAHDAAFILAKYSDLNDAAMWFIPSDEALTGITLPKSVIDGDTNAATVVAPDFAQLTLSYVFAANVSTSAPSTTTPIAWERGLQPDGTWSSDSPWQGRGGHIAFLDGHIQWFDKLNATDPNSSLFKYGTHIPTHNIADALPPGAIILPAEPGPRTNP